MDRLRLAMAKKAAIAELAALPVEAFADTKAEDALEPVRTNISDAISALNKKPADVAQALQELRAAQKKSAKGVMVGRLIHVVPGPTPPPPPPPPPAPTPGM